VARIVLGAPHAAYATVFVIDALVFIAAALLAARIGRPRRAPDYSPMIPAE